MTAEIVLLSCLVILAISAFVAIRWNGRVSYAHGCKDGYHYSKDPRSQNPSVMEAGKIIGNPTWLARKPKNTYRLKTVDVVAVQFQPNEPLNGVLHRKDGNKICVYSYTYGWVVVNPTNWILTDKSGKVEIIDDDYFQKLYEPVL